MSEDRAHEQLAEKYAGQRLREIRGDVSRVEFGELIGLEENAIMRLESGKTQVRLGRLAIIAYKLDVPLSTFILPDDENRLPNDPTKGQLECMEAQA